MNKTCGVSPAIQNEKSTFVVQIQLRQNDTWQGSLQWIEQNQNSKFNSALELLTLMHQALDESDPAVQTSPWEQDED